MKNINLKRTAFTLAETLIVLCIIGAIAVIMLSTMKNQVNKNKAMFKKAYSVLERNVVELVNDEALYPYNDAKFGFAEDSSVKIPGTSSNTLAGNSLVKFCQLLGNNLNTFDITCNASTRKFTTTDGIYWEISSVNNPVVGFMVKINVDGTDKGVNQPNSLPNNAAGFNVDKRDIFYVYVRNDGKMSVPENDTVIKDFLKSSDFNDAN